MSDTAFRYIAASNVSMAWGKVNEQLYNDILRPSPTAAASIVTPMAIVLASSAFWSLHSFLRHYLLQHLWLPFHCPQPSIYARPEHPQKAAICRDFNHRTCCYPNCQFKHICNKPGCGSRKLPWHPVPESTSAVIFQGKYLKVSWTGASSSWGVGSLSYSSIS